MRRFEESDIAKLYSDSLMVFVWSSPSLHFRNIFMHALRSPPLPAPGPLTPEPHLQHLAACFPLLSTVSTSPSLPGTHFLHTAYTLLDSPFHTFPFTISLSLHFSPCLLHLARFFTPLTKLPSTFPSLLQPRKAFLPLPNQCLLSTTPLTSSVSLHLHSYSLPSSPQPPPAFPSPLSYTVFSTSRSCIASTVHSSPLLHIFSLLPPALPPAPTFPPPPLPPPAGTFPPPSVSLFHHLAPCR